MVVAGKADAAPTGLGNFVIGLLQRCRATALGQRVFRRNRGSEILGQQLQHSLRLADDTNHIQNVYLFQPILEVVESLERLRAEQGFLA